MKPYLPLSIITILLLGLGSPRAHAGDDEAIAALGGFVAGIITGTIIDHDDDYRRSHHRGHPSRYDGAYHGRGYTSGHGYPGGGGHWEIRRVKVWVPGHWKVIRNSCGDRIRIWKPGYHTWKQERVWVSYKSGRGCRGWDD